MNGCYKSQVRLMNYFPAKLNQFPEISFQIPCYFSDMTKLPPAKAGGLAQLGAFQGAFLLYPPKVTHYFSP